MLFSSFLHIPTLFLLSASTVLADTEALVFTRPLSLPPRPTVTNYQLLGRSPYNLTANASPGTNLLYHFLQENDTSLKTDIGLSYACPDVGGGVKWMYKLSWLAQVRPFDLSPSFPYYALLAYTEKLIGSLLLLEYTLARNSHLNILLLTRRCRPNSSNLQSPPSSRHLLPSRWIQDRRNAGAHALGMDASLSLSLRRGARRSLDGYVPAGNSRDRRGGSGGVGRKS